MHTPQRNKIKVVTEETTSDPKFVNLVAASWDGDGGRTYSLYALGDDGCVYRLVPSQNVWVRIGA